VDTEAFFTTTAQVLPTLMIALAVEMYALTQDSSRAVQALREQLRAATATQSQKQAAQRRIRMRVWWSEMSVLLIMPTMTLFLAGELSAFAMLYYGDDYPQYADDAALLCGLAIAWMVLTVTFVPMFRVLRKAELMSRDDEGSVKRTV
jgi:uncharacterized BrkB/YihY/UPF0761 family membrane protein